MITVCITMGMSDSVEERRVRGCRTSRYRRYSFKFSTPGQLSCNFLKLYHSSKTVKVSYFRIIPNHRLVILEISLTKLRMKKRRLN